MRGIRIPEVKRARALRREATRPSEKCGRDCEIARLAAVIEIDGATHSGDREVAHDKMREDFLRAQGYRVIRFTNSEVYEQADRMFAAILAALAEGGR